MSRTKRLAAALALIASLTQVAHAAQYTIDAAHSEVLFKVKHLGISTITGRFANLSGAFTFAADAGETPAATAIIDAASIDTNNEKRDAHLKSPDFFDVEKYPQLTFTTTEVSSLKEGRFTVAGDLTMHGVTKPVVLEAAWSGSVKDPWGNERAAFTASTRINRKDFGLTYNQVMETGGLVVGDEIQVILEIEGVRKKS